MTYITKNDLEIAFSVENVADWSQMDGNESADNARIEAALRYGEAYVEDRFRNSKYKVPFVRVGVAWPALLQDWMCKHAAKRLYEGRGIIEGDEEGNRIRKLAREADREIDQYLSGARVLSVGSSRTGGVTPHGPIVI